MRELCIVDGCQNLGAKRGDRIRKKCDKHLRTPEQVNKRRVVREARKHPYREHRKDYCESPECQWKGRFIPMQLHVDHIDGNHSNNDPANLITLCVMCHVYKTWVNQEYLPPTQRGRNVVVFATPIA